MMIRIFSDYRKQESAAPRDIKISQTLASCDLYPRKKGAIYEAIIMQQDEKFIFASLPMQFKAEDIDKFRAGTPFPEGTPGPSLYCAVIVKRVDAQTRSKTSINELLRD